MILFRIAISSLLAVLLYAKAVPRDKLLLVSFDGFRYDYFDHYDLPTFKLIRETGSWAKDGVIPAFVTKTFPNHYSIVTGRYEESHGIVDNTMVDPILNSTFKMTTKDPRWWEDAEPLWVTVIRQKLRSATYFWPGSEIAIHGIRPNIYRKYNGSVPYEHRIRQVTSWLASNNINFATLYFEEPDKSAHDYGVFAPEMEAVMEKVDSTLSYLLENLKAKKLTDRVNLILVSDHGMTNYTNGNIIQLGNYIDLKKDVTRVVTTGCASGIIPSPGKLPYVYETLRDAHPNMMVYTKENMPKEYHYSNHRRIPPIVAIADEGFQIVTDSKFKPLIGQHGYSNFLDSMKSLFIAHGPAFKQNHTVGLFNIVDIYPLMCELIGVSPVPNNGTLQILKSVLKDEM